MPLLVSIGRGMGPRDTPGAIPPAGPMAALFASAAPYMAFGVQQLGNYSTSGYTITRASDNTTRTFNVGSTAATVQAFIDAIGHSTAQYTAWFDQSGNARDQTTGHETVDAVNGTYPRAVGDGTSDRTPLLSVSGFAQNVAGLTYSLAGKLNSLPAATTYATMFTVNSGATTARFGFGCGATAFFVNGRRVDGTGTTATNSTFPRDLAYHSFIARSIYSAGTHQLLVDDTEDTGVWLTAGNTSNTASQAAALFAGTASNFWPGEINSAVYWNSALSDPNRALARTANATLIAADPNVTQPVLRVYSTQQDRVWPVSGDVGPNGTVTFAGTYTGTTTAIEVKIFKASDNSQVVDWTNISATISGGAWSGTLTTVPAGTPGVKYYAKARKTDDTANVVTETTTWMVGARVLKLGQSNIQKDSSGTSGSAPTALTGCYRDIGGGYYVVDLPARTGEPTTNQGANGAGGDGDIEFCNRLSVALNMNVCVVNVAIVGTAQTTWLTAANGGSHTSWDNLLAVLARAEIGTDYNCAIYYQGEADAVLATTKATYKTGLTNIAAQLRTLTGRASMKIFWVPPAYDTSATAGNMDPIRQGHLEFCDTNASGNDYLAAITVDQPAALDGTHFNAAQRPIFNRRYVATIATKFLATGNGGYGPKFAGTLTATASNQKVTLPVTQNGGTALLDSGGGSAGTSLTGFRVFVNGVSKTISTTAFNGNNIELTLAALSFISTDTVAVDYLYDQPTVTNVVFDNLPLTGDSLPGRPLQPTRGQITGTAGV
jgi:hypothetical protein